MASQKDKLIIQLGIKGCKTVTWDPGVRPALLPEVLGPPHHNAQHGIIGHESVSFVLETQ